MDFYPGLPAEKPMFAVLIYLDMKLINIFLSKTTIFTGKIKKKILHI